MEFTRNQDNLALSRFREAGGFSGDRLTDVALRSMNASGCLVSETVLERCDLSDADWSRARLHAATLVSSNLRGVRLGGTSAVRVEIYYCELNECDLRGLQARRLRVHGSQAMNIRLDGSRLVVARFEETPLIRASFRGAELVHVAFADTRMGGAALDRASFENARLVDCSFRGANLRGAVFRNALLVGCDFDDALLEGVDFRGAAVVGTTLPAGTDTSPPPPPAPPGEF